MRRKSGTKNVLNLGSNNQNYTYYVSYNKSFPVDYITVDSVTINVCNKAPFN